MSKRLRKFYAWGYEDEGATPEEIREVEKTWGNVFDVDQFVALPPPKLNELELNKSRIKRIPESLQSICRDDIYERALHTYGKTIVETSRAFARDFSSAPDIVAYPQNPSDIRALLDWCGETQTAVIPFGGGSSAVMGVNPDIGDEFQGVVSVDMSDMNQVLEVDKESRSARVQAGVFGPHLDTQLKQHGLSMRFFMQAYNFSTLGGWVATRAAGHFVSTTTHIDDFVQSINMVTPEGPWESRRLPASGAGPSPDRFVMGSEGSLGIITDVWLKLPQNPTYRAGATVKFDAYANGVSATREISQAGLNPANCRLVDGNEASYTGAFKGSAAILVLGFESAHHPVDSWLDLALQACRDHGGISVGDTPEGANAAALWKKAFVREPYFREVKTSRGIGRDTVETAVTWDNFSALHSKVMSKTHAAIKEVTGREGTVTCRFTHLYPDGPAPYFTFHFCCDPNQIATTDMEIKTAAYDAMTDAGGTITHHHAIGRMHMPWYLKQRPEIFGRVLESAKAQVDPMGMMNPGVIVPTKSS